MSDARTTSDAIDLAERILDQLTRPVHDWHAIRRMASALEALAAQAAGDDPAG